MLVWLNSNQKFLWGSDENQGPCLPEYSRYACHFSNFSDLVSGDPQPGPLRVPLSLTKLMSGSEWLWSTIHVSSLICRKTKLLVISSGEEIVRMMSPESSHGCYLNSGPCRYKLDITVMCVGLGFPESTLASQRGCILKLCCREGWRAAQSPSQCLPVPWVQGGLVVYCQLVSISHSWVFFSNLCAGKL